MKNKHSILALLLLCLTLCLVLSACGKNPPEPAPDGDNEYSVTFSVNGTDTVVKVAAGQIPEFTGSTEKPDDSEHAYKFIGWDKEIVPATADTTYVAQYQTLGLATVTVRWYLADVQVNYTAHEGEQLTPPAEFSTNPKTVDKVYTFVDWMIGSDKTSNLPVVDAGMIAKKNLVIRGNYTSVAREYKVTFMNNGAVCYETTAKYGELPVYQGDKPTKAGLNFAFWTKGSDPVTGDVTCEAMFSKLDPEQIAYAYTVPLMAYSGTSDNNGDMMKKGSAVLYMAMEVRANPGKSDMYVDRILEHLRNFIKPGNTPYFDLEPYWNYVNVTSAITVCKFTPEIWNKLTADEKDAYDFIMKSFAYILAFGTSDQNNYSTGPGMMGNFGKGWNPNYKLANVVPMLFVGKYFGGAAKVDEILAAFSYDDTVAQFKERGFTRAYARWTTAPADGCPAPKQFMENGGPAYLAKRVDSTGRLSSEGGEAAGTGAGVRVKYRYQGYTLDNVAGIFNFLLADNYAGGNVINDSSAISNGKYTANNFLDQNHTALTEKEAALIGTLKAYFPVMEETDGVRTFKTDALGNWIVDTTVSSPVAGKPGMMKEMNAGDGGDGTHGGDIRVSCSYGVHDFIMIVDALAAMEELGMYDITQDANLKFFRLAWVGNEDFIFKYAHGYVSFSLGKGYTSLENTGDGYLIWKSWWNTKFGHYTYETLPEATGGTDPVTDPDAPVVLDFNTGVGSVTWSSNGMEPQNGEVYGIQQETGTSTDNYVFYYKLQCTWNRFRFLDIYSANSVGKTYEVSFRYKVIDIPDYDPAKTYSFTVDVEKNAKDGGTRFGETIVKVEKIGEWAEVKFKFNFTEDMVADEAFHIYFRFNNLGVTHKDEGVEPKFAEIMIDDIRSEVTEPDDVPNVETSVRIFDFSEKVPSLDRRGLETGASSTVEPVDGNGVLRIEGYKAYHNTIVKSMFKDTVDGRMYRLTFKYKLVSGIGEGPYTFEIRYTKEDRNSSNTIEIVSVDTVGEWQTANIEFTMALPVASITDLSIYTNGLGTGSAESGHYLLLIDDLELILLPPVEEKIVFEEKYDDKDIISIDSMPEINNVIYSTSGKTGVAIETVDTTDGKALRISQEAGSKDSYLHAGRTTGGLTNAIAGYDKIAVSFSAAKLADTACVASTFRFRAGTASNVVNPFATNDKGELYIMGKDAEGQTVTQKVGTLDTTYQNFKIVVDFEKQTVAGYAEDTLVTDVLSLVLPGEAGEKTAKEWAAGATSYLFYWYFASNGTEAPRALLLDNISIVASK